MAVYLWPEKNQSYRISLIESVFKSWAELGLSNQSVEYSKHIKKLFQFFIHNACTFMNKMVPYFYKLLLYDVRAIYIIIEYLSTWSERELK